jgi:hypothetical protein
VPPGDAVLVQGQTPADTKMGNFSLTLTPLRT